MGLTINKRELQELRSFDSAFGYCSLCVKYNLSCNVGLHNHDCGRKKHNCVCVCNIIPSVKKKNKQKKNFCLKR